MVEGYWSWDRTENERYQYQATEEDASNFSKLVEFKSQPFIPVPSFYLESFPNVLLWDDSGAVEALLSAEERYRAALSGVPALSTPPEPDLYIDKIDWNSRAPYNVPKAVDASAAASRRSRKKHHFRKNVQKDVKPNYNVSSQALTSQMPNFSLEDMGQFPPLHSPDKRGDAAAALDHSPAGNWQTSNESGVAMQEQQQTHRFGDLHVQLAVPTISGETCHNENENSWVHHKGDPYPGNWTQRWEDNKLDHVFLDAQVQTSNEKSLHRDFSKQKGTGWTGCRYVNEKFPSHNNVTYKKTIPKTGVPQWIRKRVS
ncbi:hypothetical protein O6H91_02G087000 [Diphasiastrum complanatum]|uniref:Uncharacterized protein n=1 Tax=Diphasiastrum complanatum TaxID=34168 RepID=A0ACC2EHW6_DIPCM|nr:hypothetical protein O6H91_02G087000 [Diphasiastrum complanatum]